MRRRTVLTSGVAALGAVAAQTKLPWLAAGPGRQTTGVGQQELDLLRQAALDLDAIDQRFGGDRLIATARAHLLWVHQLMEIGGISDTTVHSLQGVAGQFTISLGWFCYDAGEHDWARVYYSEGLAAALIADDHPLATRVLSNMTLQSVHLGRGREGLKFARHAHDCATRWPAPPRVAALLAMREAQSLAVLGDEPAFRRAIKQAWKAFEKGPTGDDPHWVAFLNSAEMTTLEGAGRLALGHHNPAVRLLADAADSQPLAYSRNRTMALGNLAYAAVGAGDIDRAINAVSESLDLVESGLSSTRARRQLALVHDGLSPYQSSGEVRAVTERLAAHIA